MIRPTGTRATASSSRPGSAGRSWRSTPPKTSAPPSMPLWTTRPNAFVKIASPFSLLFLTVKRMEEPNHNGGSTSAKILALSPSRRAIGAALVDGLGVARVFLCRLADLKGEEEFIAKARAWLEDIFRTEKPGIVVIEKLTPKRATRTNLMLAGLLEATAATHHVETILKASSRTALLALQMNSSGGLMARTQRQGNPSFGGLLALRRLSRAAHPRAEEARDPLPRLGTLLGAGGQGRGDGSLRP